MKTKLVKDYLLYIQKIKIISYLIYFVKFLNLIIYLKHKQKYFFCKCLIFCDSDQFKDIMRDFLISLKSYIGNNEAFWKEEKQKELTNEERKRRILSKLQNKSH